MDLQQGFIDPSTGELVVCEPEDAPLALIGHARRLLAEASTSVGAMKAVQLAKLARHIAKLRGEGIATGNEALRVEWAARLRILEEYERAQAAGEVAGRGGDRNSNVSDGNNRNEPTTADLGLRRKDLTEARKVAKAGGMDFANAVIDEATNVLVEGTTAFLLRAASSVLNAKDLAEIEDGEAEIPDGQYECIVIDPPWPMEKIARDVRPHQTGFDYPTMSEEQLAEFPVGDMALDDCHLFLWTTHKFLPMALRLAEVWGFRYVCTFVWHKPGGFQPIGLPQYNCEFALYCRKGSPKFIDTKAFPTCFDAARREHSRKPDEFYDVIARVTAGPRIEVFAREEREGFDKFGNEPDKFGEVA